MNQLESNIINAVSGKNSVEETDTEVLQKLATQYPYFGAAQYLYAKKLKLNGSSDFEKQAQKTALHFPNISWMHYLFIREELKEQAEIKPISDLVGTTSNTIQESISTVNENIIPAVEEKITEPVLKEEEKATKEISEKELSQPIEQTQKIFESTAVITEELPQFNFESLKEKDETDFETHEDEIEVDDDDQLINPKISSLLQEQAAILKKPAEENIPITTSEPYYTIDYFASQGIKLEDIKQAHDQFETKVKRFTDWLKQMKRISPQPTDLGTDTETEKIIEKIAATSNEAKEIVTEAMAEVLVKQGKLDKAVQLYIKLSFLKPDKSTYFAAKIEALKGI